MDFMERFQQRYALYVRNADLPDLHAIAAAFSHLPYENVTKILKDARSSSSKDKLRGPQEVVEDHLRWNTGGTCFSLCNALQAILLNCGYRAWIGMADMHYGPNIHCAVIVSLTGGQYLLDPGYLLHTPVPLPADHEISRTKTPMNTVLVRNEDPGIFSLYTIEKGEEKWRYRLRTEPTPPAELEQHWIHSFSLNTMDHVMMSRLNEKGRLYFRKNRLELVGHEQRTRLSLASDATLELSRVFGVPADLILQARDTVLARP